MPCRLGRVALGHVSDLVPAFLRIAAPRLDRKEKKQHGGAGGKGKWNDIDDGSMDN